MIFSWWVRSEFVSCIPDSPFPCLSSLLSQSNVHCKAAMHQKKPLAQLDGMLEDQRKHYRQDEREKES